MTRLWRVALVFVFATGLYGRARADDETKEIIDKAIKANGGVEKLAKQNAVRTKTQGTVFVNGAQLAFTIDSAYQSPDKLRTSMEFDIQGTKVKITQVVAGEKGWMSVNGQTMDLTGGLLSELQEAVYAARIESLLPLVKEEGFTLTALGESKIDDRPALGVKVACAGHKDIELYFDKETSMLLKEGRLGLDSNMKEVFKETYFSDYHDVDGLPCPKKIIVNEDGKKMFEGEILEIQLVDKIDDKEFDKPSDDGKE
jgi:hypothetical protein